MTHLKVITACRKLALWAHDFDCAVMKLLLLIGLMLSVTSGVTAQTRNARKQPAINVTGQYEARSKFAPNSMEVQQLPNGKIKFHILALWVSSYNSQNVHNGEVTGIVDFISNAATYEADGCKILLRFSKASVHVKQVEAAGDCEFGANVSASGTYRKVNSRKPKFEN
jgi:hypothetical protein